MTAAGPVDGTEPGAFRMSGGDLRDLLESHRGVLKRALFDPEGSVSTTFTQFETEEGDRMLLVTSLYAGEDLVRQKLTDWVAENLDVQTA